MPKCKSLAKTYTSKYTSWLRITFRYTSPRQDLAYIKNVKNWWRKLSKTAGKLYKKGHEIVKHTKNSQK